MDKGDGDTKRRKIDVDGSNSSRPAKQKALEVLKAINAHLDDPEPIKLLEQLRGFGDLDDGVKHELKAWWTDIEIAREDFQEALESLHVAQRTAKKLIQEQPPLPNTAQALEDVIAYAHRLSYTTNAPADFVPGQTPLHHHKPPAPQDPQLRSSLLHNLQREHQERLQAANQAAAYIPQASPPIGASPPTGEQAPSLEELLQKLPPMPPGWKQGDPIPGLPAAALTAAAVSEKEAPAPAEEAPVPGDEAPAMPRPKSEAFNFALNPDDFELVFGVDDDDESDSEESSDGD